MKFFTEKPEPTSKKQELDIKSLLKLARQYIDENNIKKARQCCKNVLRRDSQNYMALVLIGKTYGKADDALWSYEKAIELKPDSPLAWQGLAQCYETRNDTSSKIKLMEVYDKILTFDIEENYAKKILTKCYQLGCQLKNNDIISSFIKYMKVAKNETLNEIAKKQVLQLMQSGVTCKDEDLPEVKGILKNLNKSEWSKNNSELILLGELMLQQTDFSASLVNVVKLREFRESSIMRMWLCKKICHIVTSTGSLRGFNLEEYLNEIIAGIEKTSYATILSSIPYYLQGSYEEAFSKCLPVIKGHFDKIEETEALFLLNCTCRTSNISRTKNLAQFVLTKKYLKNPVFLRTVNSVLVQCYIDEYNINSALYYLARVPISEICCHIITKLGNQFLASEPINDHTWKLLRSTEYLSLFKGLKRLKDGKFNQAIEAFESCNTHPIKYYFLGISHWFRNNDDLSFANFQKAALLLPRHSKVQYCLGILYYHSKDDTVESLKCFEKSYDLCKTDINVIKILSVLYLRIGKEESEYELLRSAFELPKTREYWVCRRLARIVYNKGIMDDALSYYKAALDLCPEDPFALEMIGIIYINKKEFDNAVCAYKKILKVCRDKTELLKYLNTIGCIYSEQVLIEKAISTFDSILGIDPGNIKALKSMTDNRILCALKHAKTGSFINARNQMQLAFNRITAAMSLGKTDLRYSLIYGDILIYLARLPASYDFVNLQTSKGEVRKNNIDMFNMAIENYSKILKFQDCSTLFRCAVTYHEYYTKTKNIAFCKASYNLAVIYMKLNPNVWPIWDLLGKLCYHLNKLDSSYYCFSKALSMSKDGQFKISDDIALFYLGINKHQITSYVHFLDPIALPDLIPIHIRKRVSVINLNDNDNTKIYAVDTLNLGTVDLYKFADFVRTHSSAAQHNEPTLDSPIESLKIVPNSTDLIEWYLLYEEENACSYNLLGNLEESKGLFAPAIRYYDRAYELAHGSMRNEILSRKGQILIKMKKYEEAVNVYNEIREKNLQDTCSLASVYSKMNKFKESYALYDKAIKDLCESDEERVEVLVAMSNVAYRLHGLDNGALLILKAAKIKCGEDLNLSFLNSYVFNKVDILLVAHVMSKYFLEIIDKPLWLYHMGLNYLRGITKYAKLTIVCVKRALETNTDPDLEAKLYSLISMAELYSGNRQKALSYASRALKMHPHRIDLWSTLILCIHSDKTWPRRASVLRMVIDTARKVLHVTNSFDKWLNKIEIEIVDTPTKNPSTCDEQSISP